MQTESGAQQLAGSFVIVADHPALPGHFPGQPVVPGMVLLDHAIALLQQAMPGFQPHGIRAAKFFAPVLPGVQIDTHFQANAGLYTVTCLRGSETVMTCTLSGAIPAGSSV